MKQIIKMLLASLVLTTAGSYAKGFDSSYTSIKEKNCRTVYANDRESLQRCKSFASIKVQVTDQDLRQSIILVRNGLVYPLNFATTVTSGMMSTLGSVIEWRHKKRNTRKVVGMITRLNFSNRSYLVVSKVTKNEICVVGKVRGSNQNARARIMAERSASMSCISR